MAAAENRLSEVATETDTTNEKSPDNEIADNTPGFSNSAVGQEGDVLSTTEQNCAVQLQFSDRPEGANYDSGNAGYTESNSLGPCANNLQKKCHANRQQYFNLTYGNLTGSLEEDLETPGLLRSLAHSHGLSSLSLEVLTSGEQLNLLADRLESPESSLSNTEENIPAKNGKIEKLRESFASAGDASGCVDEDENPSGECSQCSSSLGCQEPRPSRPTPSDTPNHTSHHNRLSSSNKTQLEDLSNAPVQNTSTIDYREVTPAASSCDSDHIHSVCGSEDLDSLRQKIDPNTTLKKSFSMQSLNFFSRSTRRVSFGSIFNRKKMVDHASQIAASSTTGLILHNRPENVPAKSAAEAKHHQKLYEQMITAARKKELLKAKTQLRKQEERKEKDKIMEDCQKEWNKILPMWETVHNSRKVHDLWWDGLPPGVRGDVWKKAIGNDLNISKELYLINLRRCKERLESIGYRDRSDSNTSQKSVSREQSVEGIHLDVLRTFPTLGFFQKDGPYNRSLHDVLGAYACYRPDIGYVQGMSFLAAVLLLNMEAPDAFITLANLLNRPSYLAFFKVDHLLMKPYFDTFSRLLQSSLPRLSAHLSQLNFSPEFYLIEWIFTIYTRVLPLDVACRVWDLFCRDGDWFLYRTALGILKLYQADLFQLHTIEDIGQFLGKLPPNMNSDLLFGYIEGISISSKRFYETLHKQCALGATANDSAPSSHR